ncbi:hypothetical protein [Marivita sp. XM-24bin2]|jgi:hypothetical protein|uniref:hypothetical protein n=1 Tax=unclassified Marivita TaxID=2632480 RepID=UPI000D7B8514|nr:hypothetical protein [Marivita sp. XM-24bin2]MCR9108145.1 hypothetical protein [Paracoccaceae bacterium]PWL37063.1 MAG: hypothetical protein DCO97_00620 [Marivita sp. XM-24bin2]
MIRFALAFALIPVNLCAQQAVPRETDRLLQQAALDALLRGGTITFYDDGQSRFYEDGRYTYTYANNGGTGYGYFTVMTDSTICIEFVTGASRCDLYVFDETDRLIVITEAGDRFPTRP